MIEDEFDELTLILQILFEVEIDSRLHYVSLTSSVKRACGGNQRLETILFLVLKDFVSFDEICLREDDRLQSNDGCTTSQFRRYNGRQNETSCFFAIAEIGRISKY